PATRMPKGKTVENPLGLFEVRKGGDSDLIIPCGLGGASLIDSGVVTMPDLRVFEQEGWPDEIRRDMEYGRFEKYFKRAASVIGQHGRPFHIQMERYNQAAQAAGLLSTDDEQTGFTQIGVDYGINFDKQGFDENNLQQNPCTHCGCCMTGCNVGAKITAVDTYLQMAAKEGVHIFSQVEMRHFTREQGRYLAHVIKHKEEDEKVDWKMAPKLDRILVKLLVLSAGPTGSSEILMRSRQEHKKQKAVTGSLSRLGLDPNAVPKSSSAPLRFPSSVGKQIGRNGNWLFSIYDAKNRVDSVGLGLDQVHLDYAVGPAITGGLDSSGALAPLRETIMYYDMAFPRATALAFKASFKKADVQKAKRSLSDRISGFKRRFFEGNAITRDDTLNFSLGFMTCGHDDQVGVLKFDDDGLLVLLWQRMLEQEIHKASREHAEVLARNMGGGLVTELSPEYGIGQRALTFHLLGGCTMGNNRSQGVVNDIGAVFDPNNEKDGCAVIPRLFVIGRETIPTSLGVPPALTVAGLAERAAAKIAAQIESGDLGLGPNAQKK
ncbi:MAG: GMC family oxidoreductase N-terminal domain-containing protein, partial [Planctomycetota bacterium]|nr:GMC family oxidoreductase N-terminal domain-containing protein [Planctomycetota bacterium]